MLRHLSNNTVNRFEDKLNTVGTNLCAPCQSNAGHKVPLVGKKSLLKCLTNGYPVRLLFDSGSQVTIVDRQWTKTHISSYPVRPLKDLLNDGLEVYAVNDQTVPYDGWVKLTITHSGHEDSHLTVQAPFFLVSKWLGE